MFIASAPAKKHAVLRPPSGAARWLSCPGSVTVVPSYPNESSDASSKGDVAHDLLENGIVFGLKPDTNDPDMDINILGVLEWVKERKQEYGENTIVYAEQQYDIPETGEFGTSDITILSPRVLHIADYKDGYVPVEIKLNAQIMTYLLGAIAKYGVRQKYCISVLQPNYNHADGPYRTVEVSDDDIRWFREEVLRAVKADDFRAGKHCKKSYCPHRGGCATFAEYIRQGDNLGVGWWTSEINSLSDSDLTERLDFYDTLQGMRDEARKEAMRRIMQLDRSVDGWAIFKSREDRQFISDSERELAFAQCRLLGATDTDLYTQRPESVAGVERFVKQKFKHFGNGKWKEAFNNVIQPHIRQFSGNLTLDRVTYGGDRHERGGEFGSIAPTNGQSNTLHVI